MNRLSFIVITVSLLLLSNVGFGQEKVYTVGVQDFKEYLPYSKYSKGRYSGFNRILLDRFAKEEGIKFEYRPMSLSRLYERFIAQRVDFKYPDNSYWSSNMKKGHKIVYSDPVVHYIDGVMVVPANKGKGLGELKTLGIILGFTPFAYLKYIKSGKVQLKANPSYSGLLRQTIAGRVDGAYSNIAVSRHYLKSIGEKALVFDPGLPHTKSTRHLSSIKYPEIIKKFNAFLKKNAGEIDKLKEKHAVNLN